MIVVDTNILTYFFPDGPESEQVTSVYEQDPEWHASILWRGEVPNVVLTYLREGVLSRDDGQVLMADAELVMEGREHLVASETVLYLAHETGLSAYFSEFGVLARNLGTKLLTTARQILQSLPDLAFTPGTYVNQI